MTGSCRQQPYTTNFITIHLQGVAGVRTAVKGEIMQDMYSRTQMLLGAEAMEKIKTCRVAIFGLGGVGGFAAEALARAGVGSFLLVDNDRIAPSNLNRQIIALHSTLGRLKTDVMRERISDINPLAEVQTRAEFYLPERAAEYDFSSFSCVIDAVDTVTAKIDIVLRAQSAKVPVISCMGAGNKLDPTAFRVADIYSTSVCPLARVMRTELKKRGVKSLKVVYSTEPPLTPQGSASDGKRRQTPGSVSFVPSVAGLIAAGEAIKQMTSK